MGVKIYIFGFGQFGPDHVPERFYTTDIICNLVISGHEIGIITMNGRYFQIWNSIDKKALKISATG